MKYEALYVHRYSTPHDPLMAEAREWARYRRVLRGELPPPGWDPCRAWLEIQPPGPHRHRVLAALQQWLGEIWRRWRTVLVRRAAAVTLAGIVVLSAPPPITFGLFIRLDDVPPLDGVDVGEYSKPTFADLDDDGDLDALIGAFDGTIDYYENTGTAASPAFVARTGAANPFDGVDVGWDSAPAFVDVDDDGDLDVSVGEGDGNINYYENTGTAASPAFVERTGTANPMNGMWVGYQSTPAFVDIDDDGDYDAFIGDYYGVIKHYENTGTAASPAFVVRTGAANPLDDVDTTIMWLGGSSAPAFADVDDDGDQDFFAGCEGGSIPYYENTGTAASPAFVERTGAANPLSGRIVGVYSTPAFVDVDDDGDPDAFVGSGDGTVKYHENTGTAASPAFVERVPTNNLFVELTGAANPLSGVAESWRCAPALVDIDDDGDLDAFVGDTFGDVAYYENTGTAASPAFVERTGTSNPLNGVTVGSESTPAFVDIDDDGDPDAFIGSGYGTVKYYENTGTAASPAFVARTGAANPLNGVDVGGRSTPAFVDIDDDGDYDAFIGDYWGIIRHYENTGTAASPAFVGRGGAANPLNGVDVGNQSALTFVDVDDDGDYDAFIGDYWGHVKCHENVGTADSPILVERISTANPLNGVDAGYYSKPTFVDLDDDGDQDAVIGEFNVIKYYRCEAPHKLYLPLALRG